MFDDIKNYITDNKITFIIDVFLCIIAIAVIIYAVLKHHKTKLSMISLFVSLGFGIIAIVFKLEFLTELAIFVVIGLIIPVFLSDLNDPKKAKNKVDANDHKVLTATSKEELINTIVATVEYFSSRMIGAIITFEKNDSLNSYIDKAIKIDAKVSQELLKTIFFPNTALHDGAVIIKNGKIACASAYYPLTDKADIPSQFGTRHRAAIGISEETDALSFIISEETGLISYTLEGTISTGLTADAIRTILEQNIVAE